MKWQFHSDYLNQGWDVAQWYSALNQMSISENFSCAQEKIKIINQELLNVLGMC
jgi:hypothetical protein